MAPEVRVTQVGAITTVTLDRQHALNALTPAMHDALEAAFDAFAADNSQRVCVLTGSGRAFCAGSDLKASVVSGARAYPRHGYGGLVERFDCPKPFVAAVNGLALGGGFELALACDIIIAAEGASFGLPEPRVGAVALGGGLHRLMRAIPIKQAMGMILACRRVDSRTGERLGFVTEVVPDHELMEVCARWCRDILLGSPFAIRASKEAAYRGLNEASLADAISHQSDYAAFAAWRESDDAREGPRAFAEKRPPRWSED